MNGVNGVNGVKGVNGVNGVNGVKYLCILSPTAAAIPMMMTAVLVTGNFYTYRVSGIEHNTLSCSCHA